MGLSLRRVAVEKTPGMILGLGLAARRRRAWQAGAGRPDPSQAGRLGSGAGRRPESEAFWPFWRGRKNPIRGREKATKDPKKAFTAHLFMKSESSGRVFEAEKSPYEAWDGQKEGKKKGFGRVLKEAFSGGWGPADALSLAWRQDPRGRGANPKKKGEKQGENRRKIGVCS